MPNTTLDRRALLAGGPLAIGALTTVPALAARPVRNPAKPAFLWGTAGAAYQIEGGNEASDVWLLEHMSPTMFVEPSATPTTSITASTRTWPWSPRSASIATGSRSSGHGSNRSPARSPSPPSPTTAASWRPVIASAWRLL